MTCPHIGIDLGTTNSCIAYYNDNIDDVEIIENSYGGRTTPSVVSFSQYDTIIGDAALNNMVIDPCNTVYDSKRIIGRSFNDPYLQEDIKKWPFKVVERNGKPFIEVNYLGKVEYFAPEQISSMILTCLKENAELKLGTECKDAVITVHDGNRPLVTQDIIADSLATYKKYGSAVAAIPCVEAIFKSNNGKESTISISRDELFRTQTPHTYSLGKLLWAHEEAAKNGITNTAATCVLMNILGEKVYFSLGSEKNLKITTMDDLDIFKALVKE